MNDMPCLNRLLTVTARWIQVSPKIHFHKVIGGQLTFKILGFSLWRAWRIIQLVSVVRITSIYRPWSPAIWKGSHNPILMVINHSEVLGWSSKNFRTWCFGEVGGALKAPKKRPTANMTQIADPKQFGCEEIVFFLGCSESQFQLLSFGFKKITTCVFVRIDSESQGAGKWWCWTKWPERQAESVRDKGGTWSVLSCKSKGPNPPNATEVAGLIYGMMDHHHSLVRHPTKRPFFLEKNPWNQQISPNVWKCKSRLPIDKRNWT